MGYSPWVHKEPDLTKRRTFSLSLLLVSGKDLDKNLFQPPCQTTLSPFFTGSFEATARPSAIPVVLEASESSPSCLSVLPLTPTMPHILFLNFSDPFERYFPLMRNSNLFQFRCLTTVCYRKLDEREKKAN